MKVKIITNKEQGFHSNEKAKNQPNKSTNQSTIKPTNQRYFIYFFYYCCLKTSGTGSVLRTETLSTFGEGICNSAPVPLSGMERKVTPRYWF